MKKIILSLFVGLSLMGGLSAQTAEQILARAEQAIYVSQGATTAKFVSTYLDSKGQAVAKTSGQLFLLGEKFRLEYDNITAVYSGKTLSYYDSAEETFTLSEPSAEELLQINPLYFLRSRAKGFSIKTLPDSKGAKNLSFTPQGKANIKGIEISFSSTRSLPQEIIILSKDGSRMLVKVLDVTTGLALPASRFELKANQYPQAEVVDLR